MATIKRESIGTMPNGGEIFAFTLRNTKGTTAKVTNLGANLVSWRVMGKGYKFFDIVPADIAAPNGDVTDRDGKLGLDALLWEAEELYEGVKFTCHKDDFTGSVLYSMSNDNELSIISETNGVKLVHNALFDLTGSADINAMKKEVFADDFKGDASGEWQVRDQSPEILMEPGMFGYDPTCPIDYYDAGLRKAVNLTAESTALNLTTFFSGLYCRVEVGDKGIAVAMSDDKPVENSKWKGQAVYALKLIK